MKLILKIIAGFASVLFAVSGIGDTVIGYTDGTPIQATKRDYCFNDDKLLIGAYYADVNKIELAKEAGIEFFIDNVGNGPEAQKLLDECAKYNIGLILGGYNLPGAYKTIPDYTLNSWKNFNAEDYRDHPALWGDDLIDEPDAANYDRISECLKSYYSKTGGKKIGLVNLFPCYANEEQLQENGDLTLWQKIVLLANSSSWKFSVMYSRYVSDYINKIDTDYISVDIYPYDFKVDKDGNVEKDTCEYWLNNLDMLADACRGTGRNLWVITQAAGTIEDGKRYCEEPSDISQQAYASLAFGAKAIIHAEFAAKGWWDSDSHMIDASGNPTKTYYAVKEVDEYLKAFADVYGKYTYTSTYMVNRVRVAGNIGPKFRTTVPDEAIDIITANGLLVGTFNSEKDGKAYVITNMEELNNDVTASAKMIVPDGKTMTVYKKGKSLNYGSGEIVRLSLEPGEGVFVTIKEF